MRQSIILKHLFLSLFSVSILVFSPSLLALEKAAVNKGTTYKETGAEDLNHKQAYIAIIIDDLGYKFKLDKRAINLPGDVTYSFLPHTPYVKEMAEIVHAQGHEIMLHLPMQSKDIFIPGPGALTNEMTEYEFKASVSNSILSIPYVRGVNNHMGSLMSSQQQSMNWLMDELIKTDLFFVDSRTSVNSLAEKTAISYAVDNTRRNVFLDNELNRPAIEFQFERLINLARKTGFAVAIGHPFSITLDVLEEKIPQLERSGIQLIKVSDLIYQQSQRKISTWQVSLSPLQQAVKNSKP